MDTKNTSNPEVVSDDELDGVNGGSLSFSISKSAIALSNLSGVSSTAGAGNEMPAQPAPEPDPVPGYPAFSRVGGRVVYSKARHSPLMATVFNVLD